MWSFVSQWSSFVRRRFAYWWVALPQMQDYTTWGKVNLLMKMWLESILVNTDPRLFLKQPIFKTYLLKDSITKESNPLELEVGMLEKIDWLTKYTDGSAFIVTINAGLGVLIVFPENKHIEISASYWLLLKLPVRNLSNHYRIVNSWKHALWHNTGTLRYFLQTFTINSSNIDW